jgi:hypothetical protein
MLAPCESDIASCGDGIDNDLDGLADCLDPECSALREQNPGAGVCYGDVANGGAGGDGPGCSGEEGTIGNGGAGQCP